MNKDILALLKKNIATVSKRNEDTIHEIQNHREAANVLESHLLKDEELVRDLQDLVATYEKS